MSKKALQDYTYYSKYARYNEAEKRRETWNEAIERVKNMHLKKYPEIKGELDWAFEQVRSKRVLGSQRALQYGGKPIEKKNARMYNCISSLCDRPRFFQEAFFLLLAGSGTGFSVQKEHVAKIPDFFKYDRALLDSKVFTVPDTIEGWADALGILLATYFPHSQYQEWEGYKVEFDYSKIRPKGSPLSSGVGKAPGPEPLKNSLEKIRQLLDSRIDEGYHRLRPIDAYDIVMHSSDAVLSGGVRRSACICIFSHDDEEMLYAKTGMWMGENPQRARSNNSAMLIRDEITRDQFNKIMQLNKQWGEPGFYFSDCKENIPNPCVEISLYPIHWETGETGWQPCNLCEINGRKIKSIEDFEVAAKAAAIIGTVQAGYTKFEYLGKTSEEIAQKEALLGVSITGMMDNPDIIFDENIQRKMAKLILKINEEIASKIGINPTARATCIKPAGSTSCVLGTASGIHPHHAKRYLRRVQANSLEAPFQHFKKKNPNACEPSVWSANKTDEVITFCIEVPDGVKTKNDVSALDLLNFVKLTQQNWVKYGCVKERCVHPSLMHNVSNTINVKPDEWEEVEDFIFKNRKWFAGISILPQSGDLDYPQAPMCNVLTPREILQEFGEGSLMASGLIVDGLHVFENNLWNACEEAIKCLVIKEDSDLSLSQRDWIRRVKQFSERYCDGDVKKCCYMMKCVNNWKLWLDLNREYKDVNYTELIEEENNIKINETVACAGGKCELAL